MPVNKEIIDDLLKYEKEEQALIALYKLLLEVDISQFLNFQSAAIFKEYLEKLEYESSRHMQVMADLIHKYQKNE